MLNLITRMKKLENIKNIFYGVVMLAFLAPTILGARVYAATETQKEDVKKNSALHDEENTLPCLSGASGADISAGDISGSGSAASGVVVNGYKRGDPLGGIADTGFTQEEVDMAKNHVFGVNKSSVSFSGSGGFYVTTYGPPWSSLQGYGVTSTGQSLEGPLGPSDPTGKPRYVIAVDPKVIPYGSFVTVQPNALGWNGAFLAGDTGGAIDDKHVDVYDWTGNALVDVFSNRAGTVMPYTGDTGDAGGLPPSDDTSAGASNCSLDSFIGGEVTLVGDEAFPLAVSKGQVNEGDLTQGSCFAHGYKACDIMVDEGVQVASLRGGVVKKIGNDRCGGRSINIYNQQLDEMITYMHLGVGSERFAVDDTVNPGDIIGLVGSSSASACDSGAHLHIQAVRGSSNPSCSRISPCTGATLDTYLDMTSVLQALYQKLPS